MHCASAVVPDRVVPLLARRSRIAAFSNSMAPAELHETTSCSPSRTDDQAGAAFMETNIRAIAHGTDILMLGG